MNIKEIDKILEEVRTEVCDIADNDRNLESDNPVIKRLWDIDEKLINMKFMLEDLGDTMDKFNSKSVDIIELLETFQANNRRVV